MRKNILSVLALVLVLGVFSGSAFAQADPSATRIQNAQGLYSLTPLSSTAAVNNQVTLTIPAPPSNMYNYVCSLDFYANQDATSTAIVSAVTTSTNFFSFAFKFSLLNTANVPLHLTAFGPFAPGTGCVKSAAPGVATTFVSPAAVAQASFTWTTTYFVAP